MSRHISSTNNGPHYGVIMCDRYACDTRLPLDVELNQSAWAGPDRWLLKDAERTERDAEIREAFRVVNEAPLPEGWLGMSEPPNLDYPGQGRHSKAFCSWRCMRLYSARREQGKDA